MSATEKQRETLAKFGVKAPAMMTKQEASKAIEAAIDEAKRRSASGRLSLAQVRANDPNGGQGSQSGRHYLCPLDACRSHIDARRHRSLSIADSGEYKCHRCGSKGMLSENTVERPRMSKQEFEAARKRQETMRLFQPPLNPEQIASLAKLMAGCVPVLDTPGAKYLVERGISATIAHEAGVLFHPSWYGIGPAVVFESHDGFKRLVGAQGRYINPNITPKVRGAGKVSQGVFATPGALTPGPGDVAIAEAPLDALSVLVATGTPSIALFGTGSPAWLHRRTAFKRVVIATDGDKAGNACADRLAEILSAAYKHHRILWPEGVKDANELLLKDRRALRSACGWAV